MPACCLFGIHVLASCIAAAGLGMPQQGLAAHQSIWLHHQSISQTSLSVSSGSHDQGGHFGLSREPCNPFPRAVGTTSDIALGWTTTLQMLQQGPAGRSSEEHRFLAKSQEFTLDFISTGSCMPQCWVPNLSMRSIQATPAICNAAASDRVVVQDHRQGFATPQSACSWHTRARRMSS